MKCTYCGADIPDGMLRCPVCKREVRIVPDYNPLDEVLSEEMKESIEYTTRQIEAGDLRKYRGTGAKEYSKSTRVLSQTEIDAARSRRSQAVRRADLEERKRRERARQKRLARKRKLRAGLISAMAAVVIIVIAVFASLTSYKAQIDKGNKALLNKDYVKAEKCFKNAVSKDNKRPDAYKGFAEIYLSQEDMQKAEAVFLDAISLQPSNVELYKAAVEFYIETEQPYKISELISDCEYENVLNSLAEYISEQPKYSLEEGTYDEVQEVSLSSDGGVIYYTIDGTEPTTSSEIYTIPILLQEEGTTEIKAISVNDSGVPSLVASRKYTIELPMEAAPSVSPSTGQYETDTKISIDVPEGYTAYYTMDNTDPSDPSSYAIHYTEPVDMPEGQTIFSAVLMNNSTGKYTQVTKRNYVLEYEE